jgi:hypothetical protein
VAKCLIFPSATLLLGNPSARAASEFKPGKAPPPRDDRLARSNSTAAEPVGRLALSLVGGAPGPRPRTRRAVFAWAARRIAASDGRPCHRPASPSPRSRGSSACRGRGRVATRTRHLIAELFEANRERISELFDHTLDLIEDAFQARKIFVVRGVIVDGGPDDFDRLEETKQAHLSDTIHFGRWLRFQTGPIPQTP